MSAIRPLGGYLETDSEGFIVKRASLALIPQKYIPAIADTVAAYRQHFGDHLRAIFLRGSVAVGQAIDGVSDLDTFAIVEDGYEPDTAWVPAFNAELVGRYPLITHVEILAFPLVRALDPAGGTRLILKTQAVCLHGTDLSDAIPKFRPGAEACQHYRKLTAELLRTIDALQAKPREGEAHSRPAWIAWIVKRILRTGFELVMEREDRYTRDLYPCYASFSKWYPEKEALMRETLEVAIASVPDPDRALPMLRAWLEWMPQEIAFVFGKD